MLLINTQCNNCSSGTFCYTQDNSGSSYVLDDSPTTYCANCMSNCANCSSLDSCNQCNTGYFYYTQYNQPSAYVNTDSQTTQYCSSCISNCNKCSSLTTCDQCSSGYSFDGSACSISTLSLNPQSSTTQFNIKQIIIIIGTIIGIGVVGAISLIFCYFLSKKRKNNFNNFGQNSVKEQMINEIEIVTVRKT